MVYQPWKVFHAEEIKEASKLVFPWQKCYKIDDGFPLVIIRNSDAIGNDSIYLNLNKARHFGCNSSDKQATTSAEYVDIFHDEKKQELTLDKCVYFIESINGWISIHTVGIGLCDTTGYLVA